MISDISTHPQKHIPVLHFLLFFLKLQYLKLLLLPSSEPGESALSAKWSCASPCIQSSQRECSVEALTQILHHQTEGSLVTGLFDIATNWSLFISVTVCLSFPMSICIFLPQNLSSIYCSKPRYKPVFSGTPRNANPCLSSLPTINSMQDDFSSVIKPPNPSRPHYITIVGVFSSIQGA